VEGKVTLDNKPLTGGSVTFYPEPKGTDPVAAVGMGYIGSDGSYSLKTMMGKPGAPPGKYKVVVTPPAGGGQNMDPGAAVQAKPSAAAPVSAIPKTYADPETTRLSVEVVASPAAGAYDLKLVSR
jgi:hypothetical protein